MGIEDKKDIEKIINITSYNQSGGINAHTVNLGKQQRKLPDESKREFKKQIPITAKITIDCLLGDQEAFQYAQETKEWLLSNGYVNVEGVNQVVPNKPMKSQEVIIMPDGSVRMRIGEQESL